MQLIAGGGRRVIIANIRSMIDSGMDKETAIQKALSYARRTRKKRRRSTRRRGKDKRKRKRRKKGVRSVKRKTGVDYYRSLF